MHLEVVGDLEMQTKKASARAVIGIEQRKKRGFIRLNWPQFFTVWSRVFVYLCLAD